MKLAPITPCLWFDDQALEAAEFYTSVFPDSALGAISRYGEAGPRRAGTVLTVEFSLNGQGFLALNGGPGHAFSPAISLVIHCTEGSEQDYYWDTLVHGGAPGPCGWLQDRFGLSWQVVPEGLSALLQDPDAGRAQRALQAMLGMTKLDLPAMRRAAA